MAKTKSTARKRPPSISHEEVTKRMFQDDPEFAAEYLNQVLEDGDQEELMLAMRRVADAFGGVSEMAKRTNLHAKTLYRTLSRKGNPELRSLNALLEAMGMRITVAPLPSPRHARRQVLKAA